METNTNEQQLISIITKLVNEPSHIALNDAKLFNNLSRDYPELSQLLSRIGTMSDLKKNKDNLNTYLLFLKEQEGQKKMGEIEELEEEESEEGEGKDGTTTKVALYIYCHGQCILSSDNTFETFESPINVTKFTASGLCDTLISTRGQDHFIPLFINDIDRYYQAKTGKSIFESNIIIEVIQYIICKIFLELDCKLNKKIQHQYNKILSRNKYNYPNIDGSLAELSYKQLIDILKLHSTHEQPLVHTSRHNTSRTQRNKIFAVEPNQPFDIEFLTKCTLRIFGREIQIEPRQSLLNFIYILNKSNKEGMNEIIKEYRQEFGLSKNIKEYNFKKTQRSVSDYTSITDLTQITSISYKFLLFFLKKLGITDVIIADFSCGSLEYTSEGREQPQELVNLNKKLEWTQEPEYHTMSLFDDEDDSSAKGKRIKRTKSKRKKSKRTNSKRRKSKRKNPKK